MEKVRFTEVDSDDSTDDIFVVASFHGKVKSMYCLNYRDGSLSLKCVINIGFRAVMTILCGRMITLRDSKLNDISSWDLLMDSNATNGESPGHLSLTQSEECRHVSEKPTILMRIPLQDIDFGTDLWEPHVFGSRKDHQLLTTTTEILQVENMNTLWERCSSCFSVTRMDSFPDESPRFLYSEDGNYEIVSLKRNADESIVAESSQPFDIPKECPESEATVVAIANERTSYKRSCKTKPEAESTEVFGIAHSMELGLIAVCSGRKGDDSHIYIGLYEADDLQLLKMLPPLLAWPGREGHEGSILFGRDTMVNLDLTFTMELIVVCINYAGTDKHDFFFMQLL